MTIYRGSRLLRTLCLFGVFPLASIGLAGDLQVKVGVQRILIPAGRHGLNYFPDQPICVLQKKPLKFLMTSNVSGVGDSTVLMVGKNWESARPFSSIVKKSENGFDNGYAGAGGVYVDQKKQHVLVFYHAEDHENEFIKAGVHDWHGSIGVAESKDGGRTLRKLGQVLTSKYPPPSTGLGDISICVDKSNTFLLAHYVDYSRSKKEGVQTCVARSRIADGGIPGTWKKYYNGNFQEPGIRGRESHILSGYSRRADFYSPHVQYVKELDKYVMVFCAMFSSDALSKTDPLAKRPKMSGVYLCSSDDAIHWGEPTHLFTSYAAIIAKRRLVVHPSFHISSAKKGIVRGDLLYAFSPRWGHTHEGDVPHHLAGRALTISSSNSGITTAKTPPSRTKPLSLDSLRRMAKSVKVNRSGDPIAVDLSDISLSEEQLSQISTLSSIKRLTVPKTKLTDAGLQKLTPLMNLTGLGMWQTRVTDDGLRHVAKFSHLSYLSVEGNRRITDDGLKHLSNLQKLSWIGLSYTGVTDEGMQYLTKLPSLNRLSLAHTKLTDRGLNDLMRIKGLKTLNVTGTKVSPAGVAKFKRSMPNCKVTR